LIYHHKQDYTSKLVTNYNEKIKENKKLEKIAKEIVIPNHFLLISSNIKVKYQNDIYINSSNTLESLPKEINYENCKKLLNILYKEYNLKEEEDL
jgi:helicase conserved C-domain protein